jgi:ribose transport system substrate-binding protein
MKKGSISSAGNVYDVSAVLRACQVLRAFRLDGELLRLRDITARTGLHKATAYRTLLSLVRGGLIRQVGNKQYQAEVRLLGNKTVRLGYASMTEASVFSRDVTEGLRRAVSDTNFELVECDNRYNAKVAIRNAEYLVREKVAVAIEVQIHEVVAPIISSIFAEAKIPLIAVDIPHPGAVFYGGDNYLAGRIGGRALGKWAKLHWDGSVDAVVLLTLVAAGQVPAARMTGVAVGIHEVLPSLPQSCVVRLDGKGGYVESMRLMGKFLTRFTGRRILLGAMNDASALGAMRALEESTRSLEYVAVGQNATAAGRAELRRPDTKLIGSVAFFPEDYGEHLLRIARDILESRPVPAALFVKHALITADNVDQYYPNDALLPVPDADTLLWHFFH